MNKDHTEHGVEILLSLGIFALTLYEANLLTAIKLLVIFITISSVSIFILIVFYEYYTPDSITLRGAILASFVSSYMVVISMMSFLYLLILSIIQTYFTDLPYYKTMSYLVPLLLVIAMGLGVGFLVHRANVQKRLKVQAAPEELDVYKTIEDMENPLSISISNDMKQKVKLTITVTLPEDLEGKFQDQSIQSKKELNRDIEIAPGQREFLLVFLKYSGELVGSEYIGVRASSNSFNFERTMKIWKLR